MTNIRVRACVAVIQEGKILLVPHYHVNAEWKRWYIPGGGVEFGERLQDAAIREFLEETGLHVHIDTLLDVSEGIEPKTPYHGITITFLGHIIGGTLKAESEHFSAQYGDKTPHWFSQDDIQDKECRPLSGIQAAFANCSQQQNEC